ncbi:hypothetical protein ARHIZOSPH14_18460 [Agromyces rhizosphaerae]|uniref:Alkaline phosphatase n=1 Tax=Agromyces rhizosphaerae TaxID=88374 RepID=A0A9W6CVL1_9MICO|nr:esterase-like activity of phytase family protein [Agromyces rhizosphaerae]GLI27604.1 hypothetical protein ARHIZOSPH14_18460 [Agromyces rhizosphaerae]
MTRARRLTGLALATTALLACGAAAPALAQPNGPKYGTPATAFHRTATYPVYLNVPAGVDPADETVAEISAISPDGDTVIYTDAEGERIGFLDVTDPSNPVGAGTLALDEITDAPVASPTSVAAYGELVLVVVDTTDYDADTLASKPRSGELVAVDATTHEVVATFDLAGQPDSIAVSPDGAYAAIAMENQRNEDFPADGGVGDDGDLPQAPAGFVQVITFGGTPTDPGTWSIDPVSLTDGAALPILEAAGIDTPEDPEPEYVAINDANQLAVSLQENNALVTIDLATRAVTAAFDLGAPVVPNVDTDDDGAIELTDTIEVPREPDAIAWIGDEYVATANEGDWKGGSRGWSIFDAATGEVVWDAGDTFEHLAIAHGLYNDGRADNKGAEPEGLAVAEFDGVPTAFVASERSNFVAVYDVSDPTAPVFQQLLFATNGPEGILPVPSRDLLVVSSEVDDSEEGVRAAVNLYQVQQGEPSQPSIVSADVDGLPIGWSALGALSADPFDKGIVYAASDNALTPATVFTVDVSDKKGQAVIVDSLVVTDGGEEASFDVEGLQALEDGGFWLAVEGSSGPANALVRIDASGEVVDEVTLPDEVAAHVRNWGFEGVTITAEGTGDEALWVAIQRPLWVDPSVGAGSLELYEGNVARIGRYDLADESWAFFGIELEETGVDGDWIGLSEITAIDDDTLAIIERDKLNGPDAALKTVITVEVPDELPGEGELTILEKSLAIDVLPALQELDGWTQEKLEGFTIGIDRQVYAVTDNDGVDDATGETVFLRLGDAKKVIPAFR